MNDFQQCFTCTYLIFWAPIVRFLPGCRQRCCGTIGDRRGISPSSSYGYELVHHQQAFDGPQWMYRVGASVHPRLSFQLHPQGRPWSPIDMWACDPSSGSRQRRCRPFRCQGCWTIFLPLGYGFITSFSLFSPVSSPNIPFNLTHFPIL